MKISFDFDNTLLAGYDFENGEKLDETKIIYKSLAALVKFSMEGHEIIIVSSRLEKDKQEMIDFVKENELPVSGIYVTNLEYKKDTLSELKVDRHYDDDPEEILKLKGTGIEGILVK